MMRAMAIRLLPLSLRALLIALLVLAAAPAEAQDGLSDFFSGLFGGGRPQPSRPRERVRRLAPTQEYHWRESRPPTQKRRPAPPRRGRAPVVSTPEDRRPANTPDHGQARRPTPAAEISQKPSESAVSFRVVALGDALAGLLAAGLSEAFEDRPEIGIIDKSNASSGLARKDFHDWPKIAREIAAGSPKIDMAVVMLGENDRQPIVDNGATLEPFSPRWGEVYAARVEAVVGAFREKGVPVVWVGLPVMKDERYSADMDRLNQLARAAATRAGAAHVDLWEAFSDEKGRFRDFGPDIDGRIVRLRSGDGVHFTEAGARALANFVEKDVRRAFTARFPQDGGAPAASLAPATAAPVAVAPPPVAPAPVFVSPEAPPSIAAPALPERPAIGAPQPLTAAESGGELARRAAAPADAPQTLADHVFAQGRPLTPKPDRIDDFTWRTPH